MNTETQSIAIERKLDGIDAKCEELRLVRKHAQNRTNILAAEALAAVVLDRYPGAAFIQLVMLSEYDHVDVPNAILDDHGRPLWSMEMIGPRRHDDEAFTERIGKYAVQLNGYTADYLALSETVRDLYHVMYASDRVYGLAILS